MPAELHPEKDPITVAGHQHHSEVFHRKHYSSGCVCAQAVRQVSLLQFICKVSDYGK